MSKTVALAKTPEAERNPMDDARDLANRAADKYAQMEHNLAQAIGMRRSAEREVEALRVELSTVSRFYSELKQQMGDRVASLEIERDAYKAFGIEMSAQLKFISTMADGHASTISTAIAKALEASKHAAFAKPTIRIQPQEPDDANDGAAEVVGGIARLSRDMSHG